VQITEHTNSARLTGNLNQPNVTSYFIEWRLEDGWVKESVDYVRWFIPD
jgi:hypothetical protein